MFGIFRKESAPPSPLKDNLRQGIDNAFDWLMTNFDKEAILRRKTLRPHHSDFPIRYNGDQQTAADTLAIVAPQMELEPSDLILHFYDDTINQISTGAPTGSKLSLGILDNDPNIDNDPDQDPNGDNNPNEENDPNSNNDPNGNDDPNGDNDPNGSTDPNDKNNPTERQQQNAVPPYGRNKDGKYAITLKTSHLKAPENLVATMARELAQIKLLGEGRIAEPDQRLIDLTTLIFGLGIFNGNAAFTSQNLQLTGKNARLSQMEWGYALALYAHFRSEKKPAWTEYLVKNIKSDFQKSEQYIAYHKPPPQ
jgi:hypothetical protein